MISVEVLNQNDDVKTKRDDDGVNLGCAMRISLIRR